MIFDKLQRAHWRMLQSQTVRTIAGKAPPCEESREPYQGGQNGKPPPSISEPRRNAIRALLLVGESTRAVAAQVEVSRVTVQRYKRDLKKEGLL